VWYRATPTYKTAFGAAKVVEPAEPVDAVNQAQPRALPSQLRTHRDADWQRLQLGVQVAGATSRRPVFRGRLQRRRTYGIAECDVMTVRSHTGRGFDIEVLRP
jgi:hypothetical protein